MLEKRTHFQSCQNSYFSALGAKPMIFEKNFSKQGEILWLWGIEGVTPYIYKTSLKTLLKNLLKN